MYTTGGVKIFLTETEDFAGEEKAARLAVGPRYNGAGVEIVCHPTPLDIIVLYSSKRDEMVCLVTSNREKDFGQEKKSLPSLEIVCTPCFHAVFCLRKKSASFGNSLHPVFRCRQSILRLQTTASPHQVISTAARRLRRQKTF